VGISKGIPVDMGTLVTMLGCRGIAGSAATEAVCKTTGTKSEDMVLKNIVEKIRSENCGVMDVNASDNSVM
jgi:hypothetical protein